MAWSKVGEGALPPGKCQRLDGAAWGGEEWSKRRGALSGSDGKFNGAQAVLVTRWQTGLSGGVLGCWRSRTQTARAARGLWAGVACGALARSQHARRETGRVLGVWSSGWLRSGLGQG